MKDPMTGWAVPAAEGRAWDCVALGEVMLRLDPGEDRVRSARAFNVWEGGGEYNVARGLSRTFRRPTAVLTALPRNELGVLTESLIASARVDVRHVLWREWDGIGRNTRMGLNFTERGFGVRAPLGVSDRANSAASALTPEDFDWDALFGSGGARWLHTGGIFAALSESTARTAVTAVKAARRHGVPVSYDLNHRASLWNSHPDPSTAREVNRCIITEADLLFGDDHGLRACLGLTDDWAGRRGWPTDPAPPARAATLAFGMFPNLKGVAYTLRDPRSASANSWQGVFHDRIDRHVSVLRSDLEILDRVGGGDAFASGVIHALLNGEDGRRAAELGAAHGALAMTTPGDNANVGEDEVEALVRGDKAAARR